MNTDETLAHGIAELALEIPAETRRKLNEYLALIAKWNRVHNLTAVREIDRMVSVHVLDSLAIVPHLKASSVLDVGSGAGLPGIPLALVWPDARVVLLDSNHKKAAFLRQAVIELKLKNTEVISERVETWQALQKFDLVISRAFSDLAEFTKVAGRLCAPGGVIAAMKGVYPDEEVAQLPSDIKLERALPLKIPGLEAQRHLLMLKPAA